MVEASVKFRPKRMLVVKLTDGERELWVRFMNFYPSQVKQFAPGKRVRICFALPLAGVVAPAGAA